MDKPIDTLYVVLEQTPEGLVQAFGRNKTYKSIDSAIAHGIACGAEAHVYQRDANGAIVKLPAGTRNYTFIIVNIGDIAKQRALNILNDQV